MGNFTHVMFFLKKAHPNTRGGNCGTWMNIYVQKRAPSPAGWGRSRFRTDMSPILVFVLQSTRVGWYRYWVKKIINGLNTCQVILRLICRLQCFMAAEKHMTTSKDLDNFRFWFTMSKALAPLRKEDEIAMLPHILSTMWFLVRNGHQASCWENCLRFGLAVRRFWERVGPAMKEMFVLRSWLPSHLMVIGAWS